MNISLKKIISHLKSLNITFETIGDDVIVQKMLAFTPSIENALCYIADFVPSDVSNIKNSIIICEPDTGIIFPESNSLIITKNPQLCFYLISSLFEHKQDPIIDPQATIKADVNLGMNVAIGPYCVLEECTIGNNVIIEAGVKIKGGTLIGNNVIIQSNTVIGAVGVMWVWHEQGKKVRCVQTGNVIIRDDVFLGSNITIVRGAFENKPTIIGPDTMIAHGTMIGHGVVIGKSNHFANNVSIAGSVETGVNCFFGSGAIVRPHIKISNNTVVGAGAVVVKNHFEEGIVLVGNPAKKMNRNKNTMSGIPHAFT